MTEHSVVLNISEMIDLAIGTPEVGVVDFNMLQTVLHCLAQQLRVLGKNVEVRGSLVALPVPREKVQTIAVTEFSVDTDDHQAAPKPLPPTQTDDTTILVVERIKKIDSPIRPNSPPISGAPQSAGVPHSAESKAHQISSAIASAATVTAPHKRLSLVTISKFNVLESTVEDLKNRVYGSMPKNEEILEEVRSQTNIKAIQDMWTNLNVSSRLEAAEAGIAKLSSLVQDLINETTHLQDGKRQKRDTTIVDLKGSKSGAEHTADGVAGGAADFGPVDDLNDIAGLQALVLRLQNDLDQLTQAFFTTMKELQTGTDVNLPDPMKSTAAQSPTAPIDEMHLHLAQSSLAQDKGGKAYNATIKELMDRVNDLDRRIRECCESLGKNEGALSDQFNSFQDQLEYLSRQVASLGPSGGIGGAPPLSPDLMKDLQGLMQLFQTVQEMQGQLKNVHDTALQLAAEKDDRQSHINVLLEQIELLKTIKLDREDMTEAMADKVDLHMLARKVSQDQFEIACNDLSKGLEETIGKLNLQESLWQQALDDIQREIETKLDKMELSPVKDFFNNKLKQLQENLKQMASLRREAEAAGSKKRLLRDVNCLSCDANAVMAMDAPAALPAMPPLPATLSMKPYLSYELDAIRKAQASNLPHRNMHDWENIDKQMIQPIRPQRVRSGTDKHLCNRYCGGSHTTTTPAQRVARLGHFVRQWGPDVLPLSSGMAAGDDGKMYRVSPSEGANVGPGGAVDTMCTLKSPKKSDAPKEISISEECKCLEAQPINNYKQ